jgi:ABC-type bacteriocin/lantibiotic exporter with double-glycine peptidase domain
MLLLALMLLVGAVEVAGVASIFPLIAVVSNDSLIQSNPYLSAVYESLGFTSRNSFLVFLSVAVLLVIVLRTALVALNSYALVRFSYMRGHTLSVRLLRSYLNRKYEWFLNRHTAELSKAVFSEVDEVVSGALMPALQLAAQIVVGGCIVGLVIAIDPAIALAATATLGIGYGLVYLLLRASLTKIGSARIKSNAERFRLGQEVLGGVKEVKVGGLESAFLGRYSDASLRFSRHRADLQVASELPRYFLEVMTIGGMLAIVMVLLIRNNGEITLALPSIAIYAFAGLRLLPVIQILYRSAVLLRASLPALNALHADLATFEPSPDPRDTHPESFGGEIELAGVEYTYPNATAATLRSISLRIPVGEVVAFVGRTGAGKSTVLDVVLGLLAPQTGTLKVGGSTVDETNVKQWQNSIGYVPQHIFLSDESIAANIAFGIAAHEIDEAAVVRAAKMANIHDFITSELPLGYKTPVGERGVRLSGGQRQRVGIARALYRDPAILVLDEATSALDTLTERAVMLAISSLAERKTVIMVAHRLSTVQLCNRIFVLSAGEVAESGTWDDLIASGGLLAAMAQDASQQDEPTKD